MRLGNENPLCRRAGRGRCAYGAARAPGWSFVLLHVAAFAWFAAFLCFFFAYGPALLLPRLA